MDRMEKDSRHWLGLFKEQEELAELQGLPEADEPTAEHAPADGSRPRLRLVGPDEAV